MCCKVSWWMSVETFPIGATVDFIAFAPSKAASLFFLFHFIVITWRCTGRRRSLAATGRGDGGTGERGNGGTGGTGERWH